MTNAPRKKTPEELLREVQAEEEALTRGRLKIFLGYASGVGKSQRMLLEARRRYERGQKLVIAGLQPQVPDDVRAILAGIDVIPTLNVNGTEVIDVGRLLEMHPSACVIDGLAYDNPPGSANPTRWQDAQALLAAGISVIGSVNIQYIAELRDEVQSITGKRVSETVPLEFLKKAEEIELVDAAPERMGSERDGEAARKLAKLREIALVVAADVVDMQLSEYLATHGMEQGWGTQERVLICITPRSNIDGMLASGRAIAERFHGQLIAGYVPQPGLSEQDHAALENRLAAARNAGAQIAEIEGSDPVHAILDYARRHGITQIFVGHSQRQGLRARLIGNPVEKLIRHADGMDVRVFPQ